MSLRPSLPALAAVALCAAIVGGLTLTAPADAAAAAELPRVLEAMIDAGALGRSRLGIHVVEVETGRTVFEHRAEVPLKPASNMKLITGAAALSLLGPEYTFKTVFFAERRPADGVLRGDLYIKGHGSPGLGGEQWWLMAREIRARNIRRITGDLIGDATYFDSVDRPAGWPPPTEDAFFNAPVSALSADYSAVTIVVSPTTESKPARVELSPFSSFFRVVNKSTTGGRRPNLGIVRRFEGGKNLIVVQGKIPADAEPRIAYRSVENPTFYALAQFRDAARREGIVIAGEDRLGVVPPGALEIFTHTSRPLSDLTRVMNKLSNNLTAESLLKTLAAEVNGPPGTTEGGVAVLLDFLDKRGIDTSSLVIKDGSGLSPESRLTASSLTRLLVSMYRDFVVYPEFMASLAIGGVDGTLDRRMNGAPAQRRIRAKTGHLRDVASLSGYAFTKENKILAFSVLANTADSADVWRVRRDIDRLCSAMVETPLPAAGAAASRAGR